MAPRNVDPPPDLDKANELHEGSPLRGFATVRQWRTWLGRNHDRTRALWVKLAKRDSGVRSISYEEARDHAIAFGWIDGLRHALDDRFYAIRFTPRSKRSKWSKINREKVEVLIADGRMRPAGLAEVERAREDGRWEAAYDGAATAKVPEQFSKALEAAGLTEEFSKLKLQDRYAMLHRIQTAKREETRARLIEKFCGMISRGETIN